MDNNLSSVHTAAEIADMLLTIDDIQMVRMVVGAGERTVFSKICPLLNQTTLKELKNGM